ncbi:MAG: hypothetical protein J6Y57_00080 [Lachnospiraceae bacterium]|nr:hypothetical protein [Lachnospiraceae bacterium]
MVDENDYLEAVNHAIETKKQYLTNSLEKESQLLLSRIGEEDWTEADRTKQYEENVLPFWAKFKYVPKRFWFELSGSRDHLMDPRFLPDDLYYNEIVPYLNNGLQRYGLVNKSYYDYIFSDVKRPKTVALKIEGTYCDEKRNIISPEEMIGRCRERNGLLFIKVSSESHSGEGITPFTPSVYSDAEIKKLFEKAGPSFIIQERIRQHQILDRLNPLSVCTIRVLSLLMDNKVYIASYVIRIGGPDKLFVAENDGGLYSEILKDYRLHSRMLVNTDKWIGERNGCFDDSLVIPSMEKLFDEVRRIHPRLAHFKVIGWDFTIDEAGDPVLIEYNFAPSTGSQLVSCKPFFRDMTDWILEDYFERRTWAKNHRRNILIQ